MLLQEIKNIRSTQTMLRKFGILLTIFLSLWAIVSLWKEGTAYSSLFPLALITFIISLLFPKAFKVIYLPWMSLATVIGWVVTRVILTILYYLIITPFAVIAKILGKDVLEEKIEPEKDSYWVIRTKKTIEKKELEHQF